MKWFKWIALFIVVVFGIPLFLEFIIFRNDFQSVLTNGEWASFLGSYLGGVVSLIGIYITIQFTQNENRKERELMYRPHIRVNACKPDATYKNIIISTMSDGTHSPDGKNCSIGIQIKNVGLGPILDFSIIDLVYEHKQTGEKVSSVQVILDDILERDESVKFWFEFNLDIHDRDLDEITLDDYIKLVPHMKKGGQFSFVIKGMDLCGNPIEKKVLIDIKMQITGENSKKLKYEPYATMR